MKLKITSNKMEIVNRQEGEEREKQYGSKVKSVKEERRGVDQNAIKGKWKEQIKKRKVEKNSQ